MLVAGNGLRPGDGVADKSHVAARTSDEQDRKEQMIVLFLFPID
jgi:hypothetical protein